MKSFILALVLTVSVIVPVASQGCADPACTQKLLPCLSNIFKQNTGNTLNTDIASPYPGGTMCCDPIIAEAYCSKASGRRKRQAFNFQEFPQKQWALPIPYTFTTNINAAEQAVVQNAMSYIQAQTCVTFQQISLPTTQQFYVTIDTSSTSCVSFVGKNNETVTPIQATASCLSSFGTMVNLINQVSGVFPEILRSDSTSYITINYTNVAPADKGNFVTIQTSVLVTYGLPYDYSSIMHPAATAYSMNNFNTILTTNPLYEQTIGQRVQLSFLDSKLLNLMYCSATCKSYAALSCLNGGYQDPKACTQCRCPDGFAGTLCDKTDQPGTCSGILTATQTVQVIESPGYNNPQYYPSQTKCVWSITAPLGGNIQLQFTGPFGVHAETNVCFHWVEIRYQGLLNNTGPRFCGTTLPTAVLVSSGTQVLVIFQSNETISTNIPTEQRGFQLQYSAVNAPPCAYVTCSYGAQCLNGVCVCPAGYSGPTCQPVVSAGGVCNPNPCHNNGNCTLSTTSSLGYICSCPQGLSGPQCQSGYCGGCSASPLFPQPMCTMNAVPYQLCNMTRMCSTSTLVEEGYIESFFFGRRKRNARRRLRTIQIPCTASFCCDNAQIIGPVGNQFCAVTGWSDWSMCNSTCGGGVSERANVFIQLVTQFNVQFNDSVIASIEYQACNTQPCVCSTQPAVYSWYCPVGKKAPTCTPCNQGFQLTNGNCTSLQFPSSGGTAGGVASPQ